MEAVVSAKHLGKTIGKHTILRDISVEVTAGDVVGIIGKNGAGKTTLLDILLGFSPATNGSAALFGSDSFNLPAAVKHRVGFVPQRDELLEQFTGAQQLALNASLHQHWDSNLIGRLTQSWQVPTNRPIYKLSPGERQKLSTLLALGHQPDLLVLDEPVASLDPLARRQFMQEILAIAAAPNRTILFSTHIVSDLERVANRIWIVGDGTVVWQGALDTLKESVVRLNIHSKRPLPGDLGLTDVLATRRGESWTTVVACQWQAGAEVDLARRLNAEITVESLGLEDIFVELHS